MKPVCLLVALLTCSPALAQVPPAPPAPPAAPAPAPAPVPEPAAVPAPPVLPAPVVPPVPPAPPVPPVMAAPVVEALMHDIDFEAIAADAARAAEDAVRHLDLERIREDAFHASQEALQHIDIEALKEQAKEAAAQAKEQAREQAELFKEQAWDLARQWDFQLFSQGADAGALIGHDAALFGLQGRGPFALTSRGRDESGQYQSAKSLLERRQYEQAVARFDAVAAAKGAHADGALYWKAYAQYKLGRTDDALATIAALRQAHPQSRYVSDARVLEADARQSSGRPLTGDADDVEIKLLAINALQNSNPEAAIPLLENVLKSTNNVSVKRRAVFVLAQNELPAAHQALLRYARGEGTPDVQLEAIRYLRQNKRTTAAELEGIYNATQDPDVRRAVLEALISSRDRAALLKIAGSDAPVDIRRRAINGLGNDSMMTAPEFYQLFQKETDKGMRLSMVNAMGSMGAVDQLAQVIRSEQDADVRAQAIRSLGNIRNERTGQLLSELYTGNEDINTRRAVIAAMANQNNAAGLVALARKETNQTLKLEIVKRITEMASRDKVAMDYVMELVK